MTAEQVATLVGIALGLVFFSNGRFLELALLILLAWGADRWLA